MKLTKKQIEKIIDHTPTELKGKQVTLFETFGSYSRPGWNWGYRAGWTADGILVVTRFGEVM